MSPVEARAALHDWASDLNALTGQAQIALGKTDEASLGILRALDVAQRGFAKAAAAYADAMASED